MCVHRGALNVHKCAKVCAHIARELVPPLIRHLAISRHQGCPAPPIIDLRTKSVTKVAICRETSQRWKGEQKTCEKTCARCNISRNVRLIQSAWDAIQLLRTKNTFLSLCFFSNARALFLKRLAGPPSYLEYAVGYPSLWSAVLSPLPASHQGACCQTNRPAHCHSLRIPNKVTQLATMHLAT